MPRSQWVKNPTGWSWGNYQIERVAPRLWALTMASDEDGSVPQVVATSASLAALKHIAIRDHFRRRRIRTFWIHGCTALIALGAMSLAATYLPPMAMVAFTVVSLVVFFRSLAMIVSIATDMAWTRVRQTYQ